MTTVATVPQPARERGKIAPSKLAHFVLRTSNKDRLVNWYKTVLEAEGFYENKTVSFLTYDEEHHRIAIAQMPALKRQSRRTVGLDHTAFTYATPDDLFATYERLKDAGICPVWAINHGMTLSFYYQDPDKNFCELQVDIFDTPEQMADFMNTGDFNANPIGVNFDPDDLIARYRAGENPQTLLARPESGPPNLLELMPPEYLGSFHRFLLKLGALFGFRAL